jgi:hypothetical protein
MIRQTLQHLTADELDLLLEGSFPEGVRNHLNACPDCDRLVREERQVVQAVASLPLHVPRADFEDRVMARVLIAQPLSLLATIGRSVLGTVAESGWVVARSLASTLIEQPWYASARASLDSPTRLAFAAGGLVTTWVAGLLLLRRLVAFPAQRVAHEIL